METPNLQSLHEAHAQAHALAGGSQTSQTLETNASQSLASRNRLTTSVERFVEKDLRKAIAVAIGATKHRGVRGVDVEDTIDVLKKLGWHRLDHHPRYVALMEKQIGQYRVTIDMPGGLVRIKSRAGLIIQFPIVHSRDPNTEIVSTKINYIAWLKPPPKPQAKIELALARKLLRSEGFGGGYYEPFRLQGSEYRNFIST